jgi:hypothetical protein
VKNKKINIALFLVLSFIGNKTVLNASYCPCPCLKACLSGLFSTQKQKVQDKELEIQLQTHRISAQQLTAHVALKYEAAPDITFKAQPSLKALEQQQKANNSTDAVELAEAKPDIVISPPSQPTLTRSSSNDMSPTFHSSTQPPSPRQQYLKPNQETQKPLTRVNTLSTIKSWSTVSPNSSCSDVESINEKFATFIMTPNGTNVLRVENIPNKENDDDYDLVPDAYDIDTKK